MINEPVIIIGAPRSGTNMLRDMLVELPHVSTWPCDEINYIWRHGNILFPSDQFSIDQATPKVKKYIIQQFEKFKVKSKAEVIVEKTCANSLRIDFINEIFPNAKFIVIERDPFDVIGSAKLRWTAKLDIRYLFKKIRYVPMIDIPFYAIRYFGYRFMKLFSKEKRLGSWGPILPNMHEITVSNDLLEICAIQWRDCVKKTNKDLSKLDSKRIHKIKYEDFVSNPATEFRLLSSFLDVDVDVDVIKRVMSSVNSNSIGKGANAMTEEETDKVKKILFNKV